MDKNARVVLKDVVYDYIKEQISEGEIMLGQLINEKEIAEALQISRTPVREAIKRLQVENVLTSIDGVGTLVNELSRDEIEDIYEIRRVLEIIALKTAIFRVVDDDVMRIKKTLHGFHERLLIDESDPEIEAELAKVDSEIHDLIVNNSSNSYVRSMLKEIRFNVELYRRSAYHTRHSALESVKQHLAIVEQVKKQNLEKATQLLEAHLAWSLEMLLLAVKDSSEKERR